MADSNWNQLLTAFAAVLQSQAHKVEISSPRDTASNLQLLVRASLGSPDRERAFAALKAQQNAQADHHRLAQLFREAANVLKRGVVPPTAIPSVVAPGILDVTLALCEIADRLPDLPAKRPAGPIQRRIDRFFAECQKHPYRAEFEDALANVTKIEGLRRLAHEHWRLNRDPSVWALLEQLSDIAFEANQDLDAGLDEMKKEMRRNNGEDIVCFLVDGVEVSANPIYPLGYADLVAQQELSPLRAQNIASENLIADAIDALERAASLRTHWTSNLAVVRTILQGMRTLSPPARRTRRRGRPSKNLARQRVLAELVKVAPPGSPSEIAAVMTARYLVAMTDDEVRTELRNIEMADKKRSRSEQLLPTRERQKPGRIKGVKSSE